MGWKKFLSKAAGFVGLVVGAFAPGIGMALGYAIGSMIGAQIAGAPKGPSLGDITEQTAKEGGPRPIVIGMSKPIAGNIIWKRNVEKRWVKKNGQSIETPFRTYAIGFCEGPISGFVRVWRNGKKVFDVFDPEFIEGGSFPESSIIGRIGPSPLWGDSLANLSLNALFLRKARFYNGYYDQVADPLMIEDHGPQACAHQGTACMVIEDEDETDVGGAIPAWTVQVRSHGVPLEYGQAGVIREVITDAHPTETWTPPEGVTWVSAALIGPGGMGGQVPGGDVRYAAAGGGAAGQVKWFSYVPVAGPVTIRVDPRDTSARDSTLFGDLEALRGRSGGQPYDSTGTGQGGGGSASTSGLVTSVDPPVWSYYRNPAGSGLSDGQPARLTTHTVSSFGYNAAIGGGGAGAGASAPNNLNAQPDGGEGIYLGDKIGTDLGDDGWFGGGGAGTPGTFATTSPVGGPAIGPGTGGRGGGGSGSTTLGDSITNALPTTGGGGGAQQRTAFNWPVDFGKGATGLLVLLYYDPGVWGGVDDPSSQVSLRTTLSIICDRAGVSEVARDFSLIPAETLCDGITVTNEYPACEAINALSGAYLFDCADIDNKLTFVPRGGNSVATITEDDMVDDDSQIDDVTRSDSISIPRLLNILYCDTDAGILNSLKQTSERAGDFRAKDEVSIESAVLMGADKAAQLVDIMHKQIIEEAKGQLRFALPEKWAWLVPTNPIVVQWDGQSVRARITECELMDGYQNYVAVRDRQSAYTSSIEGIPAPTQTEIGSTTRGPTLVVPLDIPLIQDADDRVGYYVATAGLMTSWRGASLGVSRDGGTTWGDAASQNRPAVIGELTETLPAHAAEVPDYTSEIKVMIFSANPSLSETDLAGMLNRRNLAAVGSPEDGWELVNFAVVVPPVDNVWTLTTLLRGRRGTVAREHALGANAPLFVLLDPDSVLFVETPPTDMGNTLQVRAIGYGGSDADAVGVEMPFSAQTRVERPPGYLTAERAGSNITVEWQQVARLGTGARPVHGIGFAGTRVVFDDGVDQIVVETSSTTVTQNVSALSTPITVRAYQLNELTGPGRPAEVELA